MSPSTTELHVFVDASPQTYGTAIYVRSINTDGAISTRLLISKSRVAPIKTITLPRLELLACLLGACLIENVLKTPSFDNPQTSLWTESKIALYWIKGDSSRWQPFVRNRVDEINRLSDPARWAHCSSSHNPADLVTRGISASALKNEARWWTRPTWLSQPKHTWPREERQSPPDLPLNEETQMSTANPVKTANLPKVLQLHHYGSLTRVLRITAWMQRFVTNSSQSRLSITGPLTSAELRRAETYWISITQSESFPEAFDEPHQKDSTLTTSKIGNLHPFVGEDKLLHVGGRLQELDDLPDVKHPILLPCKHEFTDLLVSNTHRRLMHGGVQATLTELRARFWIIKGRQTVKRITNKCLPCRRRRLAP